MPHTESCQISFCLWLPAHQHGMPCGKVSCRSHALAEKEMSSYHTHTHNLLVSWSQIPPVFSQQYRSSTFSIFFSSFFFYNIDLFYVKSAFHLTFKIEESMVQLLPKPLASCYYGTTLQVCLATDLRQEVLQIYCSCFFINCQHLQLQQFKIHQNTKEILRTNWK